MREGFEAAAEGGSHNRGFTKMAVRACNCLRVTGRGARASQSTMTSAEGSLAWSSEWAAELLKVMRME